MSLLFAVLVKVLKAFFVERKETKIKVKRTIEKTGESETSKLIVEVNAKTEYRKNVTKDKREESVSQQSKQSLGKIKKH